MRLLLLLPALLLPIAAFAQDPGADGESFPQFRNLSGLPGGGYGVRPDGTLGIDGAMAFTTPVAYSLGARRLALTIGAMSFDRKIRFDTGDESLAGMNGTAAGMFGVAGRGFNVSIGGMVLSNIGDSVLNVHVSPTAEVNGMRLGIGVQDAFSTGSAFGDIHKHGGDSRSVYGVMTKHFVESGAYLSAGVGSHRFRDIFFNGSIPLGKSARGYAEYDGRWIGFGAAYQAGPATLHLGLIDGKYAAYSLAFGF